MGTGLPGMAAAAGARRPWPGTAPSRSAALPSGGEGTGGGGPAPDGLPPGELRRLELLSAEVPLPQWIVFGTEDLAPLVATAAARSAAPIAAAAGPDPLPAMRQLQAAGLRGRVLLLPGDTGQAAAHWRGPIALLVLPARQPHLRAVVGAWAGGVATRGHILFVGGAAPPLAALGLDPKRWKAHESRAGTFLLTRLPFG